MSDGLLCTCPKHPPGTTRRDEPACPHYAAHQQLGGLCQSCMFGFHQPCPTPVLHVGVLEGECLRCRWHSSEHS